MQARAQALAGFQNFFEHAVEDAASHEQGEALLQALQLSWERQTRTTHTSGRRVETTTRPQVDWNSLTHYARTYACLGYMKPPHASYFQKKLSKNTRYKSPTCALRDLFQSALAKLKNHDGTSGGCSLSCLSAGKCSKKDALGQCKSCLKAGSCGTTGNFPACPLDKMALNKIQRIWETLHEELSGHDKDRRCKVALVDSGLWLARPDRKIGNPEAIVDLQTFPGRSLGIRRIRSSGNDEIRLHFQTGKELGFHSSIKREHLGPGMRWSVPSGHDHLDDMFHRLSSRIRMCEVKRIGFFNYHFEKHGSLASDLKDYFLGNTLRSGEVAAFFISQASITAYRTADGKGFFGPDSAGTVFGDPEKGASPAAWWTEMRRLSREEGWGHKGEQFGNDVCLDCSPNFAGGYSRANFANIAGDCVCGEGETPYVFTDPDGKAPLPRFLSWTSEAKKDFAEYDDIRGLWHHPERLLEHMHVPLVRFSQATKVKDRIVDILFSVPTTMIVGLLDYSADQADEDADSDLTKSSFTKDKPGYDYNMDLMDHCFVAALVNLPEEMNLQIGSHVGDYTRLRLCTNHWERRFDSSHPLASRLPEDLVRTAATARADVVEELMAVVASVAPFIPTRKDGDQTARGSPDGVDQPQCLAIDPKDKDQNACIAGLDLVPGFNSPCFENPSNPCPEGHKCVCDMGLDSASGIAKAVMAFAVVQSVQFLMWWGSTGKPLVALTTQMCAGPSDIMNAYILLAIVQGKSGCKCSSIGFPTLNWKKETFASGCLFKPKAAEGEGEGMINQLNPYWFLPPPGTRVVPGKASVLAGLTMGGVSGWMAGSMVGDWSTGVAGGVTGGLSGAILSSRLAKCSVTKCVLGDLAMGWVDGQGFANCDVMALEGGQLDYNQRLAVYARRLKEDPAIANITEQAARLFPNRPLPVQRLWELGLRMKFPKHFGLPKGMLTQGKPEFAMTASKYFLTQNPASKLAWAAVELALGLLDTVGDVVVSVVKLLAKAIKYPFKRSSRRVTQSLIVRYYYSQCMAVRCLIQMHGGKNLKGGIVPRKQDLDRCGYELPDKGDLSAIIPKKSTVLFEEPQLTDADFADMRMRHILDQMLSGDARIEQEGQN